MYFTDQFSCVLCLLLYFSFYITDYVLKFKNSTIMVWSSILQDFNNWQISALKLIFVPKKDLNRRYFLYLKPKQPWNMLLTINYTVMVWSVKYTKIILLCVFSYIWKPKLPYVVLFSNNSSIIHWSVKCMILTFLSLLP